MKVTITTLCLLTASICNCFGQIDLIPVVKPVFTQNISASELNYKTFTIKRKSVNEQWKARNIAYTQHPDAGYIAKEQPAGNVVEVLEKRTETTRFYVDADFPTRVFSQGAYGALHYKNQGQWLMIDSRLDDKGNGLIEASHQVEPVGFEIGSRKSYIRTAGGKVHFNNWKLFGQSSGKQVLLAAPNWEDYTAGDDGVYIKNLFPGIDAEMQVLRGRVKTNLIIQNWKFKGYESYLFADTFEAPQAGTFTPVTHDDNTTGEMDFKVQGKLMARIGRAVVYSERDPESAIMMPYTLKNNQLGIQISQGTMDQLLAKGKVVIDPMVVGPEGVFNPTSVLNSYHNANCSYDFSNSCSYNWTVPIPPFISVTGVNYISHTMTYAPCTRDKMRFIYGLGDTLCGKDILWSAVGLPPTPGETSNVLVTSQYYNDCIKAGCEQTNLKVRVSIIRACMGPVGCESSCVEGSGPFIMTIEGRTLEMTSILASPNSTQCPGDVVNLSATADWGIKPHKFLWTPGSLPGSEIAVNPGKTTNYKVTVTDACNQKVSDTVSVTVPKAGPAMTVQATASTNEICFGTAVDFSAKVTNVTDPVYQWKLNGVNIPGANAATFRADKIAQNDVVTVEVTNPEKCAYPKTLVSNELKIKVHPPALPDETARLVNCKAVDFEGVAYKRDTTFQIKLQNSFGCDSLTRIIQIVIEPFELELSASGNPNLRAGDQVDFETSSKTGPFEITGWHPPTLFADQQAVSQLIRVTENDTIFVVYGKTPDGCLDSASIALKFYPQPFGNLLPNVFTPNGDGLNDLWEPLKKSAFPVGELFVYNRWGECIFHTQDYTVPWDGRQKGAKIPAGVYPYRLIVSGKFEFKGSVTVLY